ncbi:unnamed protein product [Phytomonas sp. Hart1]|nr:unnamed protein product [Phytomonas sp. Hart1]|eukprot:CCW71237.1 unnamed protein product [Phytomonas sp. isolate Hart1]
MPKSWVLDISHKAIERLNRKQFWKLIRAIINLPPPVEAAALREALRELGIFISDSNYADLCESYGELNVNVPELINEIFELFSPRRRYVLNLILKKIDPKCTGLIPLETIDLEYDTMRHPDVSNHMRDPDEVKMAFTNAFEGAGNFSDDNKSQLIMAEELMGYYLGISLTTPKDEDFELRCIRSFSLDRPKVVISSDDIEREILGSRADSKMSRLLGQGSSHPLYTTSNNEYGRNSTSKDAQSVCSKYGLSHKFTKSILCQFNGATSMNM